MRNLYLLNTAIFSMKIYLFTFIVEKKSHSLVLTQRQKPQQLLTLKMYTDKSSRAKRALEYGKKHPTSTTLQHLVKETIRDPKKKLEL